MKPELKDRYEPKSVEEKWIKEWESRKSFEPSGNGEHFSVVIPPPNVTGTLHIGHALNHTIQDIIIRLERKKGKNTVWVPGMDHAGIATQVVVEKQLAQKNQKRTDFTREEFINKVWEWKKESGGQIKSQQRLLGESVDWSRERFTFDEGLSHAVSKVFIDLYKEGLIYRGERIINWCPVTKTAISDIEVEYKEKQGNLYHLKYPIYNEKGKFLVVATTRPETMFGDVAVCAHPDDKRYNQLKNCMLELPLTNRKIPLLFDPFVDQSFGSGLVKITPAHDPNDFEAGQRLNLKPLLIMNLDGTLNSETGKYANMDRFEARKKVVKELEELGLIEKIENHIHSVGHNQRGGAVIEPILSTQWFVKISPLALPAIDAVKTGNIEFIPKMWEKTYFEWMENIKDWCISRQLWWGHRIPAYYTPDGEMAVALSPEDAISDFSKRGIKADLTTIKRDEDVLDTWFSSGLWPFSVFGWPDNHEELNKYYPTSILVTGFDIIFFWVARMIMMGLKFNQKVPFKKVLIHGLVRDKDGKKFSKSLGNVVDPLVMMDKYGTDSFRFFLAAVLPEGRDILFDESRLDGYRSFCNKIWNSSRFLFMNLPDEIRLEKYDLTQCTTLESSDVWLLNKFDETLNSYLKAYEQYHFFDMASVIYDFLWGEFCDWYIEIIKPRIYDKSTPESKLTALRVMKGVLEKSLGLLHPIMPFITEELFSVFERQNLLVNEPFPIPFDVKTQNSEYEIIELNKEIINKIRNMKAELGLKPDQKPSVIIISKDPLSKSALVEGMGYIAQLSRSGQVVFDPNYSKKEDDSISAYSKGEISISLEGLIDKNKEIQRLKKEIDSITQEMTKINQKISNEAFLSKAKPEVIQKEKEKYKILEDKEKIIKEALRKYEK
jgi:valyl-tRNA synthetase